MSAASKEALALSNLPLLESANQGEKVSPLVAAAALMAQLDRYVRNSRDACAGDTVHLIHDC